MNRWKATRNVTLVQLGQGPNAAVCLDKAIGQSLLMISGRDGSWVHDTGKGLESWGGWGGAVTRRQSPAIERPKRSRHRKMAHAVLTIELPIEQ